MTWSPSLRLLTPGPTSTTTPAPSWPITLGNKPSGSDPESVYASVWHTPVAFTSTRTSPSLGPSKSTVSMLNGSFAPKATAALTSISAPPSPCTAQHHSTGRGPTRARDDVIRPSVPQGKPQARRETLTLDRAVPIIKSSFKGEARGDCTRVDGSGFAEARRDHRRGRAAVQGASAAVWGPDRGRPRGARGRGDFELADSASADGLGHSRRGVEDFRRRRGRVRGLARRLRRRGGRARPPEDRRGAGAAGAAWHALRAADGGRHRGCGGAGAQVRAPAVALLKLGDRGDHGRRASDARDHGPRPDRQGRGLLPRAPRLRHGLRLERGGRDRPCRAPEERSLRDRNSQRDHGPHPDRPLQRPRRFGEGL